MITKIIIWVNPRPFGIGEPRIDAAVQFGTRDGQERRIARRAGLSLQQAQQLVAELYDQG